MTDKQALEIISQMHGTDDEVNEALTIAEDCLAREIRYAERDKEGFGGRCPYTNKGCDDFHCWRCEVEKEEEEWLKSEDNEVENNG